MLGAGLRPASSGTIGLNVSKTLVTDLLGALPHRDLPGSSVSFWEDPSTSGHFGSSLGDPHIQRDRRCA
jgi:hypothetical protein